MKFSSTFVAAAAALFPLVNAHAQLTMPAPYTFNGDNAPLAGDGSNFPCKMPGGAYSGGNIAPAGEIMTYTPGQVGQFRINGTAVHGGGSCQISITYDNPPTKDSTFKVVQSYEGGCPFMTKGNIDPADPTHGLPEFPVTLPEGLQAGDATFVWTWFNKVGNREMYMNCAPIKIGGSGNSMDTYKELPDMFVANIEAPKKQCTTQETFDIQFPNPGKNVIKSTDTAQCNFAPACGGAGGSTGGDAGGSTGGNAGGSAGGNTGGNAGGNDGMYTPPVPAPTEAPIPGNGNGGAFVGITSTIYNAPPNSIFTPIAGSPSTTMSTVAAKPTGSYGNGSSGGSSSGPSDGNGGSTGGSTGGPMDGGSSGPSYGSGGSMGGGNGSAPVGSTCDGSWIVKCDDSDPTHFTLCYGRGQMAQKMACNPGMTCKQIAAAHEGSYKNKFRRHAHEHVKRTLRTHKRH